MSKNVPTDPKLWDKILDLARGESNKPVTANGESVNPVNDGKGFRTFPSAYANGWALAQYKRLGGKWKKESSEYKTPRKWDKEHCESKTCDEMGFSEKASCRPYKNCYKSAGERLTDRYLIARDDKKMKNTGMGGLDTWFAGHGGGKPDERATWGDWVAITPIKHTVKREDKEDKVYEAGDIVGPCAVSSEKEWAEVTGNGSKPLKCMPREKAYDMTKEQRATLARKKRREEAKHRGQKPVNTPTFDEEAKEMIKDKKADFYRQVTPPDQLSSFSNGSDVGRADETSAGASSLPSGDTARNIGRPSPDSPNLKYRNLDRGESVGRRPAERADLGYVHDSGSGSARVIPYDSGFANNSSALRNAGLIKPPQRLVDRVTKIAQGLVAQHVLQKEEEDSAKGGLTQDAVDGLEFSLDEIETLPIGIRRGEYDEEEVIFQINSLQRSSQEIEKQLKDADLGYPLFDKIKSKIDILDPAEIFANPNGSRALIGSIGDLQYEVLKELKRWTTSPARYVPALVREDYEEAVKSLNRESYYSRNSRQVVIKDEEYGLLFVLLQTTPKAMRSRGSYKWDNYHSIYINVLPKFSGELPLNYLNEFEDIVAHELVHATQVHLANNAEIEIGRAGNPFSKKDEQYTQHLKDKEIELKREYAREGGADTDLISIHALDDIEFYSRLLDETKLFKRKNRVVDNQSILRWTSDRPFFVSLKRYKPKNWRKAMGIFYDAVSHQMTKKAVQRVARRKILSGGHEGSYMSRQNLEEMREMAEFLLDHVDFEGELDDWVEDKISHAHGAVSDVARFIGYGKGRA